LKNEADVHTLYSQTWLLQSTAWMQCCVWSILFTICQYISDANVVRVRGYACKRARVYELPGLSKWGMKLDIFQNIMKLHLASPQSSEECLINLSSWLAYKDNEILW
jgi:hypothetical protein